MNGCLPEVYLTKSQNIRQVSRMMALTRGRLKRYAARRQRELFQSKYGFHALSPDWVRQLGLPPKRTGMETLSCLMNATAFAGFTFGFIGNEAFGPPK